MATIIKKGKKISVENGSNLREPLEELGVPFSCENGTCATCLVKINKGKENLSELNDKEKIMGLESEKGNLRLGCQCCIKHGEVELEEY